MRNFFLCMAGLLCGAAQVATAAAPCDFKGLSVGDHFTPRQIMSHFGIATYTTIDPPQSEEQKKAEFDAQLKRAKKVGLTNAAEEREEREGPACRPGYCRIPYGDVSVGNEPLPIQVGTFVAFDKTGMITEIDVSYDVISWGEVLELLNRKYEDNWQREDTQAVLTDYETKKTELRTVTSLTHRIPGTNRKTGDKCTITATSIDAIWLHTTLPIYRSELAIKLLSKNF